MTIYQVYIGLWFGLLCIAVANGALRELVYGPTLSELGAHQLSTLTACCAFFLYTWLVGKRWPIVDGTTAMKIGLMWLLMTVVFETWMVMVLQGKDLQALLHSYDIASGQLWVLVLLTALLSPLAVVKIRQWRSG
jgi:hypothetical protein